ncbi:tail fiber protein [Marinifilum sp.]|uniref:tail fiber protein n=1 Tax=Marinifilum sp. TaxID=2033137 RepID=UPI003BABC756
MKKIYYLIFILLLNIPIANAQSIQGKQEIKNHFQNGNAPGAIHFGYLIDACYNYSVGEGLIYDSANNLLKSEVPLNVLYNKLSDTARILRQERTHEFTILKNSLSNSETNLSGKIIDLENRMRAEHSDTATQIRLDFRNSLNTFNASLQNDYNSLSNKVKQNKNEIVQSLKDSTISLRSYIQQENLSLESKIGSLQSAVENDFIQFDQNKTNEIADTAKSLRSNFSLLNQTTNSKLSDEVGRIEGLLSDNNNKMLDTAKNIRTDFNLKINQQNNNLLDTANSIRNTITHLNSNLDKKISDEVSRIEDLLSDNNNKMLDAAKNIRTDFNLEINQQNDNLRDTANSIRNTISHLNSNLDKKFSDEVIRLDANINKAELALQDTALQIRSDFKIKLEYLEVALQDTSKVIRKSISDLNESLQLKIETGDADLELLLTDAKLSLRKKIDSLAEVHNLDRIAQENRMMAIEENHQDVRDTVYKMKVKLDTLNYTEKNFTNTLKEKLLNIDDGATRSDNNFTDELKSKLDGIENNANNYQLPLGTHGKLGGIQLSQDFVLYNGKAYNALDADKIDRQYATDTIIKNWTSEMKDGDQWTRLRYKMENGSVDAEGNKLYDYGEWNQAYKFIYDDLETSYYEFNATDSTNVILGIHEKNKKFLGEDNTLIGHSAGYTLYKGGDRNVLLGKSAGRSSQGISDNVLIGNQAGESIGDPDIVSVISGEYNGERNVALGSKAMQGRNASGKSVAIGYSAMELGEQNSTIAIGYKAANSNSGSNNIAIGYEAAHSIPGSNTNNNIAIGYRSAFNTSYAKRNIFVGDSSAFSNESGTGNIFIGHGSGKSNKGSGNLFIGNDMELNGDNKLLIGNNNNVLISGDFSANTVSINKLNTQNLEVVNSSSNSYSIGSNEVINATSQYVGQGGVNTPGRVVSSYANSKASTTTAIAAPNGTVNAKYVSANQSIQIGASEVVNSTAEFVGSGGVNTTGDISTNANLTANDLQSNTAKFTQSLQVAGIDIVKHDGTNITERYATQNHIHLPAEISTNTENRFVKDSDISNWNNKVDKVLGKALSTNDFTTAYKSKLDGISVGANKYVHPSSHSASMIMQDASHRFITDTDKTKWNNKVDKVSGKALSSKDFTAAYKSKLDGIAAGANKYVHPTNHSASMITQDASHRFVSDTDKTKWNNKVDKVSGKTLSSKDFTAAYKSKLDGIAAGANKYVHPGSHSASMITQDATHRFISDSERNTWNNKVDKVSGKGLSTNDFTSTHKSKLDGIAAGANQYVHPANHSANMIIQDASHRFISDSERNTWNNKVNKVSGKALSSNDFTSAYKSKLDGVATGANKYVHPANHSANMISTTTDKQFVSQSEKDNWNAGQIPVGGIIMWNGTTVPNGWALCNGQTVNGKVTPDLRGRFIVGSYAGKSGFNVGNSGGIVTNAGQTSTSGGHNHTGNTGGYKLTSSDLPEHRHNMAHTHKIPAKKGARYSSTTDESNPGGSGKGSRRTMNNTRDYNFSTEAASTSYTGYTGRSSSNMNAHKHTISSDGSHVHTVPYYVLAFIMRVE